MLKVIQAGFVIGSVYSVADPIIKVIFPLTQKPLFQPRRCPLCSQLKELRETYKDNQQLQAKRQ